MFRLFAPKAAAVEAVIGIKSGPYEPQGTTTAAMTKEAAGLWSVTLGPLEPNLYEYQFSLDGRKIADPSNDMPKPQRQVDTSLLLSPVHPMICLLHFGDCSILGTDQILKGFSMASRTPGRSSDAIGEHVNPFWAVNPFWDRSDIERFQHGKPNPGRVLTLRFSPR
jgi:hypothetical protein